jgi:hypothetical protein
VSTLDAAPGQSFPECRLGIARQRPNKGRATTDAHPVLAIRAILTNVGSLDDTASDIAGKG